MKGKNNMLINVLLLLTILGLVGMGVVTYVVGNNLHNSELVQQTQWSDYPYYVGVAIISFMGIMILLTLLLCAVKHGCIAFFYGLILFVLFIAFVGTGVGFLYIKQEGPGYIYSQCSITNMNSPLWQVDTIYTNANMYVCNANCTCEANYQQWSQSVNALRYPYFSTNSGATQFQECQGAVYIMDQLAQGQWDQNVTMGMMALDALETDFGCAGICQVSTFYTFSNITQGPPFQNCSQALVTEINNNFVKYGIISFALSLGTLLGMMASCISCCCNKKQHIDHEYVQAHGGYSTNSRNDVLIITAAGENRVY